MNARLDVNELKIKMMNQIKILRRRLKDGITIQFGTNFSFFILFTRKCEE